MYYKSIIFDRNTNDTSKYWQHGQRVSAIILTVHSLHCRPTAFSLHWHWPSSLLQTSETEPLVWHWQAAGEERRGEEISLYILYTLSSHTKPSLTLINNSKPSSHIQWDSHAPLFVIVLLPITATLCEHSVFNFYWGKKTHPHNVLHIQSDAWTSQIPSGK